MVSFDTGDFVVLALYGAVVLAVGFLATRRQRDGIDFLLAGRTLTLPLFVMTLVSTWYGGILGVGEFSWRYGISNWVVQGLPYYFFAVIFALTLARKIRRTNLLTIPDRLEEVYDRKTALVGAGLTFLLTSPAPYILMVGVLIQMVLGWPLTLSVLVGTVVTIAYLFSGGLRADIYTDVVEFIVMFAGFGVAVPIAVGKLGGISYIADHVPPLHLTWSGGNPWQFILVWFFIALWTLVDPAFHQRCYAAKDERTARNGILLSIPFWFIFDALTAVTGLYARAVLPDIDQPVMAFPLFAEKVLPPVAKGLFFAGMLATVMSTLNTTTFISGTTLGRDLFLRWKSGLTTDHDIRWTRLGLLVTAIVAIVLCLLIPSVIDLWYVIGTTMIPGLLVPVLASYFDTLLVETRYAFPAMILGWVVSTGWLVAGWAGSPGEHAYPLGIEPMFAGLGVSIVVWMTGIARRRTTGLTRPPAV